MNDLGLFPERTRKAPNARVAVIHEPVILKPYVPRAPLSYQLLTDEDLVAYQGSQLVFDSECFNNFFLVAFKHPASQKVLTFQAPFDAQKLQWVLENYTLVGFNSLTYDLPLISLSLQNQDTSILKQASNDLISGMRLSRVQQKYGFSVLQTKHIDLIEVCPSHGSLKLYGARLHAPRIQDVPWAAEQALEDWQIEVTKDYCINDLDTTELIFNSLQEQLALRTVFSKEYGQDLMSKSDAQIAEAVIGSELKKITGKYPSRPKVRVNEVYRFVPPSNLQFQTEYMRGVLKTVSDVEFRLDNDGRLVAPKEIKNLEVKIGNMTYRMGVGGLHSTEENRSLTKG